MYHDLPVEHVVVLRSYAGLIRAAAEAILASLFPKSTLAKTDVLLAQLFFFFTTKPMWSEHIHIIHTLPNSKSWGTIASIFLD